ncbi:MAG: DUF6326 family protein [Candidatus Tumulicola sp.]
MPKSGEPSSDVKVHAKIKIAALWASVMCCCVYGDYFGLYKPGTLQGMLGERMGPLGAVTQGVLLGTSTMMAIPAVMVFLSLVLWAPLNRWLNDPGRVGLLYNPRSRRNGADRPFDLSARAGNSVANAGLAVEVEARGGRTARWRDRAHR